MGKADLNKDKFGNDPVNSFIQLELVQCFLESVYCFCKANKIRRKYRISSCENNRKYLKWKQKWKKGRMYYMYGQWMENKDSKNTQLSRDIRKYLRMNFMGYLRWLVFGMRFFNTRTHSGLFIHTTKNLRRCSKFILRKTDLSYF